MQQDDWRALTESAVALLKQNQPTQALTLLQRAEQQAPAERTVRYWLANAYRKNDRADTALRIFRALLEEKPDDLEAAFAAAFLLRDAGRPGDAASILLDASGQPAVSVEGLLQIAGFLRDSNQFAAAIQVCERAATLRPGQADLHFKLARLYQASGEFTLALAALRKTLDLQASLGPAWTSLAQLQRFHSTDDDDFKRIQSASKRSHGSEADMCLAFAAGKALDDLQRWPDAWAQYRKGNDLMAKAAPWHRDVWVEFVERKVAAAVAPKTATDQPDRGAVFIIGMPRSGTTLLEQLLDRHPDIAARGELNFLAHAAQQDSGAASGRQQMASALWTQLRLEGPENGSYIDKNPLNFRYLDLLFDLLPTAKVLHVSRDGRDSCLSCFFQLFQHADTAFSNDLRDLSDYYAGYRRLMAHWEEAYAERILRVRYEALVGSSREVLAGVLDFLGLGWDDALLQTDAKERLVRTASAWQARQPIHTRSLNRWQHYVDQDPDFFARLSDIDAKYDIEMHDGHT